MKLRDTLNTEAKYIENIDFDSTCNTRDLNEYQENVNSWDEERIRVQFEDMLRRNYQIIISKYSLGLPVSVLIEDYKQGIYFMQMGWRLEGGYVVMLWYLSLGILLEIENEEFEKLVQLVLRDKLEDYLVDYLINSKIKSYNKQTEGLYIKKPYESLKEVISIAQTDKSAAVDRLQKYVTKEWYKGQSGMGWYDDHKSKWAVHFGYWSFESGAVAKILELDDSILKDEQYYPYDLVHWKD